MLNTTINSNTAGGEGGGGLFQRYGGTVSLINSVIANSEANYDCLLSDGVFSAHMNNLIEDGICDVDSAGFCGPRMATTMEMPFVISGHLKFSAR